MNRMIGDNRLSGIDKDVCWKLLRKMLLRTKEEGVILPDIFKILSKALPETKDEDQSLRLVKKYLAILRKEHKIEYKNKRWFLVVD